MPHSVNYDDRLFCPSDRTFSSDLQQAIESLQYLDIVSACTTPHCGNCQHFIAQDGKASGICEVHCDRVLPQDRPCLDYCGGLA